MSVLVLCTNLLGNSWSCSALPVAWKDALWLQAGSRDSWMWWQRGLELLERPWSSSVTQGIQQKFHMKYVKYRDARKHQNCCLFLPKPCWLQICSDKQIFCNLYLCQLHFPFVLNLCTLKSRTCFALSVNQQTKIHLHYKKCF